jgi:hypothetical protein
MSPLAVMARGYSLTFKAADATLVRSAAEVEVGEALVIRVLPKGEGPERSGLGDCELIEAQVTAKRESGLSLLGLEEKAGGPPRPH